MPWLFWILATLAIVLWRRPDQITAPFIWCEDGSQVLPQYIAHGAASLFEPVSGYLILPAKLIEVTAFRLSFTHYPAVAVALTLLFTAFVVWAIASSPTYLRFPKLCALAALLVPSNPEVYGVPLYAFWWGALLLMLSVLWREGQEGRRWLFTVIGGLSTPLTLPLSLLLVLRALLERTRHATIIAATAVTAAVVQGYFLLHGGEATEPMPKAAVFLYNAVRKFFGMYASYNWWPSGREWIEPAAGIVVLAVLVAAAWQARRGLDRPFLLLLAVFAIVLAASMTRVNIAGALDPQSGGPRYFFFPWLVMTWIFLWLLELGGARIAVIAVLVLSIVNGAKIMQRRHVHWSWQSEIARCAATNGRYALPVHFDGVSDPWRVEIEGADCRRLVAESVFQ